MSPILDGFVPPLLIMGGAMVLGMCRHIFAGGPERSRLMGDIAVMVAVAGLAGVLELQMGRVPTYQNGRIRLWSGDINSDQNSQQVFDPYSFTHLVHGATLYGITRAALRSAPFRVCAVVVVTIEAAWEVYENTDQVIRQYRSTTISRGYVGDSVLNSMADIVACVVGLLLARRLPLATTLLWVAGLELMLAVWIRDNMTLNIIMLIHPIAVIRTWQAGL